MFTGIIEELGRVRSVHARADQHHLTIAASAVLVGTELGHSINVDGVCLTVTHLAADGFTVGLAPETLARTALGQLQPGHGVNLERAVAAGGRMGGHYVQGHVDGTGTLAALTPVRDALDVRIACAPGLARYIVEKGYIAIDGTSLTVTAVGPDWFTVQLIAYTQSHITLPHKPVGAAVNLEVDILAKYVERLLAVRMTDPTSPLPPSP